MIDCIILKVPFNGLIEKFFIISGKLVRPNKTNISSKYFIQFIPNLIIIPRKIKKSNVKMPTTIAVCDDNRPGSNNKFTPPIMADKKIRLEDLI